MKGRYRKIFGIILICLSVLPLALRADGYQIADRLPYHASSVYYVTLQNAEGENINSQYAAVEGAIGAFVGDELRGVSQWQTAEKAAGKGVFVIRVWGGNDDDATVSFRLHDSKGLEYIIGQQPFAKDQEGTYGLPSAPIAMTLKPVTGISLPFTEITLKLGQTRSVQPSLVPEDHSTLLTTLKYTYSSDNAAVTVSDNGIVNTEAVGQAKVTVKATPGDFTAQATVKVEPAPQHVAVTEIKNNMASTDIEMVEGDELLLDFSVLPEDATDKAVKFTNDYNIVGIKQETETSPVTIVAKKEGKSELTVISVDNEQATLTYHITVKKKVVLVTKIEVSPTTLNAYLGETYSFTLSVLPENATNKNITASIEDPSIVDLDLENLTITAKAIGSTKIVFRAKDGSNTETTLTVTVSAVPVVTLSFATQTLTAYKQRDVALTLSKEGTADFLPSRVELVFSKAANGEPSAIATKADNTGLKWTVRGQYIGKHSVKIKYNDKEQSSTCQVNVPAEYSVNTGWDWVSFYAAPTTGLPSSTTLEALSNDDEGRRIYEVRSQEQFVRYDNTYGYFGNLETLSAGGGSYRFMTMVSDDNVYKLDFVLGTENLASAPLEQSLVPGYTWMGYPYEFDHSFERLADELSAVAEEGDMIIGRDGFAEYTGEDWKTTDDFILQAGKGYVYYNAGKSEKTLKWTSSNLAPDPEPAAIRHKARQLAKTMYGYPETMPVVAKLSDESLDGDVVVRAYVGNELRGESRPVAGGCCQIAVAGNKGETVTFALFEENSEKETPLQQKVTFTQKVGSHKAPLQLNVLSAPGTADLASEALYDLLGRKVCSGQPDSQYKKGVYLKATVSEGRVVVRKIIKK